ncbi:MAG: phospholipase D-like domain-containing protein [Lentisphaeria bacterium]|jgi:phosphatidylserine/phosphatidylglycerophosphate/cardiolipin synthase-like enzyme|nr:phospholipase D-like domain-containing protein [Lentisphaeria bacterium]MDP7741993.1 phospholipase D-like domain-containing protein [Lentisphaeria bacterium]
MIHRQHHHPAAALLAGFAAAALLLLGTGNAEARRLRDAKVAVGFGADCEEILLDTIKKARREIYVAVYSFTRRQIAEALIDKHDDGVMVHVKMDTGQAAGQWSKPIVNKLRRHGISVDLIKMPPYKHMHHKFIVVDGRYVVTGSYNFTTAATEANWENVVLIDGEPVAAAYIKEWKRIKDKGKKG